MDMSAPGIETLPRVARERDALREMIWQWYAAGVALDELHPAERAGSAEASRLHAAAQRLRDEAANNANCRPVAGPPRRRAAPAPADDTGDAIVALLHAASVDNPWGWRLHIERDQDVDTIVVAVHTAQGLINGTGSTLRDAVCSASKQVAARAAQCSAWGAAVSQHVGAINTPDPASRE